MVSVFVFVASTALFFPNFIFEVTSSVLVFMADVICVVFDVFLDVNCDDISEFTLLDIIPDVTNDNKGEFVALDVVPSVISDTTLGVTIFSSLMFKSSL